MKKLILSLGILGLSFAAKSQIIFSVESPASIQGFYDFKGNDDGSGWGLSSLAGILVVDTVVVADDGTPGVNAQGNPASATGCNAFTAPQAANLAGKIAMVFRGDGGNPAVGACNFGLKALNCQNAGAVAVIIVNRDGSTISMAGSTEGASVTIPVIMINQQTGVSIMNTINGGTDVVALIGDKTGYFGDDITVDATSSLRADFGSLPIALAQNASELSIPLGTWVYNYGSNDQTGITVHATISNGSTNVYDNTSTSFDLVSGDSMYVTMPTFSLPSYTAGNYTVAYNASWGGTDEFVGDNTAINKFSLSSSLWSLVSLDSATNNIKAENFYRPSTTPAQSFESCAVFKNANAGRIAMDGIYYGGLTVNAADTVAQPMDGAELSWTLYDWNDADQTISTGVITDITEVASGSSYMPDPASPAFETTLFIPITSGTKYQLVNNQSYLVCFNSLYPLAFLGFNTSDHYDIQINTDDLIRFPQRTDGSTWANAGFSGLPVPSIAMHVGTNLSVAENSTIESSAYPNPSMDVVTVKINANGDATLKVTDMAGRVVSTQDVKIAGGQFTTNVAGMNAGTYVFTLDLKNGTTSRFNVVVTK